ALAVLGLVVERGRPLSELRRVMQRFPQVLENLRVRSKPDVETLPAVAAAIHDAERTLGGRGRGLVRYARTQPRLRGMVEGERGPAIRKLAGAIVDAARAAIGA